MGAAADVQDGFGALLRRQRVAAGLTQEELAERSGLGVRTISDMERGRTTRPHRRSVDLLSRALDLRGPARDELAAPLAGGLGEAAAPAAVPADRPGSAGRARSARNEQVVPRQLPAGIRHFAGRAAELEVLDGLLDRVGGAPGTVIISAIGGTAGVGKTTLAVHWAHRAAERFPDGQLYVNLRGFDPAGPPVAPAEAIRGFLDAFQVPVDRIPASPDAQGGLYRSLLAGKRMLIVLDNARDAAQIRPLLPGSPACCVIVTSRSRLTSLAATQDAHLLALDVLTEGGARELLSRRLGPDRVLGDSGAVNELIGLCARLPLALAIAAARAAAGPAHSVSALVEELRRPQGRLDALDAGDATTSARAVFSWSYQSLSDPAARMFRLLGIHPGPEVSAAAAASLAGVKLDQARGTLKELTLANLLAEHAGRFAFHDLLRAYAAEQARSSDGADDCRAAMLRALDYYLHAAWAAERLVNSTRDLIALPAPAPGVIVEHFIGHSEALGWFHAEHQVLLAMIALAADSGFDSHAWQLASALRTFFDRRGYWRDWVAAQHIALRAAQRSGDVVGQAHANRDFGLASIQLGCYQDAQAYLRSALEAYQRIGDDSGQGHAHLDAARAFEGEGRPAEALGQSEMALELYRKGGHRVGEARALNAIGWYHALLGNPRLTLVYCEQPLDSLRELGDRHAEAGTWDSLGYAHLRLGHYQDAIACYRHALCLLRGLHDRYLEAHTLVRLGDAHHAAGHSQVACEAWQNALVILEDLRHTDASSVRAKLSARRVGRQVKVPHAAC